MQSDESFRQDMFAGKVALVTGGTSGIGEATAAYLAELGAEVIAVGLNAGDCALPSGNQISVVEADVTDAGRMKDLFAGLDRLDILVNCAGLARPGEEHEMKTFEFVLSVNLTATMRLSELAYPLLKKTKGSIVNIASMYSYFGSDEHPAYAASKGGVAQLTKSHAQAWAKDGVRVNAVAPGWISTRLSAGLEADPEGSRFIYERTPFGRWGKPREIAQPIAFLCSAAAGFVTGIILPVDGGYLTV